MALGEMGEEKKPNPKPYGNIPQSTVPEREEKR